MNYMNSNSNSLDNKLIFVSLLVNLFIITSDVIPEVVNRTGSYEIKPEAIKSDRKLKN